MTTLEKNSAAGTPHPDREIVLTRTFDAPRELVFTVWTDPKHLEVWWGGKDYPVSTLAIDVRPGGLWRFIMNGPDGTKYDNRIEFLEIVPNERIEYLHGADKDDDPERFRVTTTFTAQGSKTKVTCYSLLPTAAQRARVVSFGAIEIGQAHLQSCADLLTRLQRT